MILKHYSLMYSNLKDGFPKTGTRLFKYTGEFYSICMKLELLLLYLGAPIIVKYT